MIANIYTAVTNRPLDNNVIGLFTTPQTAYHRPETTPVARLCLLMVVDSADTPDYRLHQLLLGEPSLAVVQPVVHDVVRVFLHVVVELFEPLLAAFVCADLQKLESDLLRGLAMRTNRIKGDKTNWSAWSVVRPMSRVRVRPPSFLVELLIGHRQTTLEISDQRRNVLPWVCRWFVRFGHE